MLSKSEKKYLRFPKLIPANYKYVLKHRITNKIYDLQSDLDLFLKANTFHKDWLKSIFENYLARIDWD